MSSAHSWVEVEDGLADAAANEEVAVQVPGRAGGHEDAVVVPVLASDHDRALAVVRNLPVRNSAACL